MKATFGETTNVPNYVVLTEASLRLKNQSAAFVNLAVVTSNVKLIDRDTVYISFLTAAC